jgi:hypothetical protein
MGSDLPPGRAEEVEAVLAHLVEWSSRHPDVLAVALLGSWARGEPRADSDVDLVVICEEPARYLADDGWLEGFHPGAQVIRRRAWGPLLEERRLSLPSGLVVEFGFTDERWAAIGPVDPGTDQVVREGFRALVDPNGLLRKLIG